jgi:serine/threonine-protein kinase
MEAPSTVRQTPEGVALPVEVGQVVAGKYSVERILARGGAGVVVRAKHLHLLEPCAIKFMLPKALATPMARERFLREARACARLKGDHVVRVFDVGELDAETPYMVLEYLEGIDLEERVARSKPIPVAEAIDYVLQICAGLAEAHALGIVHRDLKPGNVFLTRLADGTTRVKLLDFGISKDLYDAPGDGQAQTADGILVGSPLFMAPEQVRADDIDTRTDLWAVGVILYYLVTGAFPFEGAKASDTMAHILHRVPKPPCERVPAVPKALEKVILQCLEKEPARRPASANELAALLAVLADESSTITLPVRRLLESTADPRVSIVGGRVTAIPAPPARRRWVLPAVIATLALALGVVVALLLRPPPVGATAAEAPQVVAAPATATASATEAPPPPAPSVTAQLSSRPALAGSASASVPSPVPPPATRGDAPRPSGTLGDAPRPSATVRRPGSGASSQGFDLGSRH